MPTMMSTCWTVLSYLHSFNPMYREGEALITYFSSPGRLNRCSALVFRQTISHMQLNFDLFVRGSCDLTTFSAPIILVGAVLCAGQSTCDVLLRSRSSLHLPTMHFWKWWPIVASWIREQRLYIRAAQHWERRIKHRVLYLWYFCVQSSSGSEDDD